MSGGWARAPAAASASWSSPTTSSATSPRPSTTRRSGPSGWWVRTPASSGGGSSLVRHGDRGRRLPELLDGCAGRLRLVPGEEVGHEGAPGGPHQDGGHAEQGPHP